MVVRRGCRGGIYLSMAALFAAGLVIPIAVASSFQITAAAVPMLLGIDTLMDLGWTAMNVIGNCMAAAVVARWEGELIVPGRLPS